MTQVYFGGMKMLSKIPFRTVSAPLPHFFETDPHTFSMWIGIRYVDDK